MSAEPLSDGLECCESLGQLHLAQFSQRQKEYPGIGSTSLGFVSVQQEKNLSIWERQEKIDLLLADLHPRRQWQQQAKRVHILGPHLCCLCSAVLSIIFTAARHILSHVLSTLPVIRCRSSTAEEQWHANRFSEGCWRLTNVIGKSGEHDLCCGIFCWGR